MRIRGVGVIDDAVLDLSPGLNVLTGETGAGKTMVVSGLGLLLGERADSGLVRTGSDLGPRRGGRPAARSTIRRSSAPTRPAPTTTTASSSSPAPSPRPAAPARTSAVARPPSRCWPSSGQLLVAVHGQADQWRLKQGDAHRVVLDDFGGAGAHRAPRPRRRAARPVAGLRARARASRLRGPRAGPGDRLAHRLPRGDRGRRPPARGGRRAARRGRAAGPRRHASPRRRAGARRPQRRRVCRRAGPQRA